jgi:hypothetical protein
LLRSLLSCFDDFAWRRALRITCPHWPTTGCAPYDESRRVLMSGSHYLGLGHRLKG